MSLLNTTNDGLPNVLSALCTALFLAKGSMQEAELMAKVAPEEIVYEKGKMVRQTLNRWVDLGLFARNDGQVILSSYFPPKEALRHADHAAVIRRAVRKCALAAENNRELWAREGSRAADLTRSLCLLLAQDVYGTGFAQLEARENEQVVNAELRLVQNDTRVSGLKKWSHFLGFVRLPDGGDIDPTVAMRESVEEWMPRGESMQTTAFLARLAEELPVLDGGQYRRAVEEKLNRQNMFVPGAGEVSSSLSRALLALRATGELVFENQSDFEGGLTLAGRDGVRPDLRFTHVTRAEKSE
jgi:hypothetical protein